MKGIVLAGGTGSRLFPLTKITNKHLLPIYDKPMIYYPIQTLVDAGITRSLIVTGGRNSGDFLRLLANGKEFGLKHINYTYQEGEGGIADALALAEHFADGQTDLRGAGRQHHRRQHSRRPSTTFEQQERGRQDSAQGSARTPSASAWPRFDGDRIVGIEEKPAAARNRTMPSPAFTCTTQPCSTRSRRWCPRRAASWKSPTSTTPTSAKAR